MSVRRQADVPTMDGRLDGFPLRVGRLRLGRASWRGLGVTLLMLMLTYQVWLPPIGGWLIAADPLVHADALVPLAGDATRALYAAQLMREGYAPRLIATGMTLPARFGDYRFADDVKRQVVRQGVWPEQVLVAQPTAATTYGEALIVREIAEQQGFHSLLIVTSPSHTRRAGLIFRDVFRDSGISISVRSVAPHWYSAQTWWRSAGGWRETRDEYAKLVLYFGGYHRFWR